MPTGSKQDALPGNAAAASAPGTAVPRLDPGLLAQNCAGRLAWQHPDRGLWLFQADCLPFLDALHEANGGQGVVDTIFADPPYFLSNGGVTCHAGRMVKVDKGDWDKSRGPDLNHAFTREWLARCQKVLQPHGTIWVTGTQHIIFSVGFAMQQLGYKILNMISWEKPNPPPNLSCRYFTHSTELVIWAARDAKSRHVFNYQAMRQANHGKQMKTVWRLPAPGAAEKALGKHPTQKPLNLVQRCLLASTREGGLVLDPFSGNGTTAVAAAKLNRRCLAVEIDPHWTRVAAERLQDAVARSKLETLPLLPE